MTKRLAGTYHEILDIPARTEIEFEQRANGTLLLYPDQDTDSLDLNLHAKAFSWNKILLVRKENRPLKVNIRLEADQDAALHFGYLDLEKAGLDFHLEGELQQEGASIEVYTGQLADQEGKRTNDIHVRHKQPHTFGNIHNFAVVKDKADYEMAATGAIEKGCRDSESHQETRVLTLGTGHKTKVLPILLIDENDVKASHAMSVGQPDENQLYYLQSRGLSTEAAIGLLATGYFLPLLDLCGDEKRKEELRTQLEQKAGLYGH